MDNNIIEMVPNQHMIDHYQNLQAMCIYVKREQPMFAWSFKHKCYPDVPLNKNKARVCCHGGKKKGRA